jgi:sec-independent protein translocase protein TatB
MNFFGIGPLEVMVIAVIAVIVLGPERFPAAAVQVARAIKFLRGYATDTTSQLRGEFAELTREYEALRGELNEMKSTVAGGVSSLAAEIEKTTSQARPALKQVMDATAPIVEPGGELPPERAGDNGATQG